MENNTNQLNSMMCKRNCGFFGNAACDGYCSKCYKDHVKRQNSGSAAGRVTPTTGLTTSNAAAAVAAANQISNEAATKSIIEDIQQNQEATNRLISNVNSNSEINNEQQQQQQSTATFASSSVPIPIPSRSNSKPMDTIDPCGMSVPAELMSSSLLSTSTSPGGAGTSIGDSSLAGTSGGSEKKKRTRCVVESCRRKVGLTGFDCRCGGLFCWEHRYSDKHNCQFDYKELGQDQIRKNNPIVVGEKIQKI